MRILYSFIHIYSHIFPNHILGTLLPFCHPLPIDHCSITIDRSKDIQNALEIKCHVKVCHKTGVEMEALTGASVAALCIYDMCKAVSHDMVIRDTKLVSKTGGKSDV